MSEKLKKCLVARKLTRTELEESRNTTAKIIKKLHGGLVSERAECVELHTTLRRLATLLENSQFTEEEKTALHQCLLNVNGKEEFFLEPIAADENPPLTVDELRQMEGEPVYLVMNTVSCWAVIMEFSITGESVSFNSGQNELLMQDYCKTWLAYRRK